MAVPDLLVAVLWGLVWQLPWIAGLVFAWLLYRRWKASSSALVALVLGLLIVWGVTGPLVMLDARRAFGVDLLTASAISFLSDVVSIVLVLFLAMAFFWLMKDLAGKVER